MKNILILFFFFFFYVTSFSQNLSTEEKKLYDMIMAYRLEKGLPKIPLSKSMTLVAQTHVKDLVNNKPDLNGCNAHSWSSNGNWTACCYTPDHAQAKHMWDKPRELTSYKGNGYEIAVGSNGCCSNFVMTADYALNSWKKSSGHNMVIINESVWKKRPWNAIGIAIYKGFAVVWFGEETDPDTEIKATPKTDPEKAKETNLKTRSEATEATEANPSSIEMKTINRKRNPKMKP